MAARFFHDLDKMGFRRGLYYLMSTATRGLAEAIGAYRRVLYNRFEKNIG